MTKISPETTVKCRVRMGGTIIRGDSGEHGSPGSTEKVEFGDPVQHVELTYEKAVALLGKDNADELFSGVVEEGDFKQ